VHIVTEYWETTMRFFTDQFFTEEEKARIASCKLPSKLVQHQPVRHQPASHTNTHNTFNTHSMETPYTAKADTSEFEKTSKRVEFVFLGGILGFYAVAALLDMLARTHTLSI